MLLLSLTERIPLALKGCSVATSPLRSQAGDWAQRWCCRSPLPCTTHPKNPSVPPTFSSTTKRRAARTSCPRQPDAVGTHQPKLRLSETITEPPRPRWASSGGAEGAVPAASRRAGGATCRQRGSLTHREMGWKAQTTAVGSGNSWGCSSPAHPSTVFLAKRSAGPSRLSPPRPVALRTVAERAPSAWKDTLDGASDRDRGQGWLRCLHSPVTRRLLTLQPPQLEMLNVIKYSLAAVKLSYKLPGKRLPSVSRTFLLIWREAETSPLLPVKLLLYAWSQAHSQTPEFEPFCSSLYSHTWFNLFHMKKELF